MEKQARKLYTDTIGPGDISEELAPEIRKLGLEQNCRELAERGWTVVENVLGDEFNEAFRKKILEIAGSTGGAQMLLKKDSLFGRAVLAPKLMALAEFSVGRGFLLSQVAASVRAKGSPSIGLHADHNWLPAPFPAHNMLLTACWACDSYTQENGATLIIPDRAELKRHPSHEEIEALEGAQPIECEPGSVAIWDGNIWHSNYVRKTEGLRVVCHITYSRLMMRPVENYSAWSDELVREHGPRMAQLLGHDDFLDSPKGADYSKLEQTFNNAKR